MHASANWENNSELQFAFGQYVIIKLLYCVQIVTLSSEGQLHDLKIILKLRIYLNKKTNKLIGDFPSIYY